VWLRASLRRCAIAMLVVVWVCEVVEPGAPKIEHVLAMRFAELGVLDSALEG
jgi:hypothetical protein